MDYLCVLYMPCLHSTIYFLWFVVLAFLHVQMYVSTSPSVFCTCSNKELKLKEKKRKNLKELNFSQDAPQCTKG